MSRRRVSDHGRCKEREDMPQQQHLPHDDHSERGREEVAWHLLLAAHSKEVKSSK